MCNRVLEGTPGQLERQSVPQGEIITLGRFKTSGREGR